MVDSKNLEISNGTIIKDSEMLRLIPDYSKTKKICKHAIEKVAVYNKVCPWWSCQ